MATSCLGVLTWAVGEEKLEGGGGIGLALASHFSEPRNTPSYIRSRSPTEI